MKKRILDIQFQTGQAEAVITLLDHFKGFDAKGYFTLNHSLLTGMTANFVTYLVILVQMVNVGKIQLTYNEYLCFQSLHT